MADSTESVRTTLRLETELHERISVAAQAADRSFNSWVEQALTHYVDSWHSHTTEQAPAFDLRRIRVNEAGNAHEMVVDGHPVPSIVVHEIPAGTPGGNDDETSYTLILDRRFSTTAVSRDTLLTWGWFVAQAMAVAAGFSSHGENSLLINPHGPNIDLQKYGFDVGHGHGYAEGYEAGYIDADNGYDQKFDSTRVEAGMPFDPRYRRPETPQDMVIPCDLACGHEGEHYSADGDPYKGST